MKAYLKNYRQSPRKVRLVADLVRGKRVEDAMIELSFLPKRASSAVSKLIKSASANAQHNFKVDGKDLFVKEITVDQGITLKRVRPRSRGMANRINKRTSNLAVTLGIKEDKKKSAKKAPKQNSEQGVKKTSPKKTAKKTTAKKAAKKAAKKTTTKKTTKN